MPHQTGAILKMTEVYKCQKKDKGTPFSGVHHLAGLLKEGVVLTLGGLGLLAALQKSSHLWH